MQEKIFKVKKKTFVWSVLIVFFCFIHRFKAKLDAVKTYMSLRRVPNNLEDRVIRWYVRFIRFVCHYSFNQLLGLIIYG